MRIGGQDAHRRENARGYIRQGRAAFHGRPVRALAGEAHDPAHRLRNEIEAAPMLVGTGAAEPGERAVDQRRIILAQVLIAEAKPLHYLGAKFSTSTSAVAISRRRMLLPPSVLRSSTIPRLLRFIIRKAAASSPIFGGIMWRVSSPLGAFSILMTSAPISASISVQVGPAMTCVRSITFKPVNGPIGRSC